MTFISGQEVGRRGCEVIGQCGKPSHPIMELYFAFTGEAYMRTFRAPDWSIAVPHRGKGAIEGLPRGDDGSGEQEREHHRGLIPSGHGSSIPNLLAE